MRGSIRCPLYWPRKWPAWLAQCKEIPPLKWIHPQLIWPWPLLLRGERCYLFQDWFLSFFLSCGREWMSSKVIFGKKLLNCLHRSPFSCWQVCGLAFCVFPLLDSFPRSLLKCSLALALGVFRRQISACVILNPKRSISSSLPARATRIQLEKPPVVILIF